VRLHECGNACGIVSVKEDMKARQWGKGSKVIRVLVAPGRLKCGHGTLFVAKKQRCYECERLKDLANKSARMSEG
jgi:hypothetical protein